MNFKDDFPYTPAVEENKYSAPFISLLRLDKVVTEKIGNLTVEVKPDSLTLVIMNNKGQNIQHIVFENDGNLPSNLVNTRYWAWVKAKTTTRYVLAYPTNSVRPPGSNGQYAAALAK